MNGPELKLPEADEIRARIDALKAEVKRLSALLKLVEGEKPKPMTEALETK